MKRQKKNKDQLPLFSPKNNASENQAQPQAIGGKQVFMNPRQEILNKILNRKME
jgi:hypothetical protein